MEFNRLPVRRFPSTPGYVRSADAECWKKFVNPVLVHEFAAVTHLHFSPTAPHDLAVSSSTRVQVYSAQSRTVSKTLSRFKDVVNCATFRNDGKLIVAGDQSGIVQLFDMNSRVILRQFNGHVSPVRVTKFTPDNTHIISAGDDRTVRFWDVPTGQQVLCLEGHEDYIRTGATSHESSELFVTGSYDHTLRLWDSRSGQCTMTMKHGEPVESVLYYPGGGVIASSGGNQIKIWDVLSGGKLLRTISNHQKTITCLASDASYSRILSGSLDHAVKVYDVRDYRVVHSAKYASPILSVALSPDETLLAAGMTTGLLSIRERKVPISEIAERQAEKRGMIRGGTYKFFMRGTSHKGDTSSDFRVLSRRRQRLSEFDKMLKSFRFKDALDNVLATQSANVVTAMFEELSHRGVLRAALSGRDQTTLEPILLFLVRQVVNPRFCAVLIDVANLVLDMYAPVLGQSPRIDELFSRMRRKIHDEIEFHKQIAQLMGAMDAIFASSELRGAASKESSSALLSTSTASS